MTPSNPAKIAFLWREYPKKNKPATKTLIVAGGSSFERPLWSEWHANYEAAADVESIW